MNQPTVTRLVDGHLYRWQEPDYVEIEISDIVQKSGDWNSYVTVRTRAPGFSPHLMEGKLNLVSTNTRASWAKDLGGRYETRMPWRSYLEMACVLTVRAERDGDEFREVGSLPGDQAPPLWLIDKTLRLNAANSIFGDGGVGKSTLAALLGACVAAGTELAGFNPNYMGPVLWLDWEADEWDVDDTIKCLRAGHGPFPDFHYRRETLPLTLTFKQVQRQVAMEKIALVVIDSVGYAMGGDPESASDTLRFTNAVRALNTTVLLIDHIRKGDSGGKAFGSAYKHNEVRAAFEVVRQQTPGEAVSHLGVYQRKANKGGFVPPFGLRVEFGEGLIRYQREEIREEELVEKLSVRERVYRALSEATGLLNADEIAEEADAPVGQVKARLSAMAARDEVYVTSARGTARRYGLKSAAVEVGPR